METQAYNKKETFIVLLLNKSMTSCHLQDYFVTAFLFCLIHSVLE